MLTVTTVTTGEGKVLPRKCLGECGTQKELWIGLEGNFTLL